ncbi:MAG: class I SAM-dependent methyltransferase, partial [Snowella sp.]|nr:class I SAM-dependent methyltransferase [Snowella sp.]
EVLYAEAGNNYDAVPWARLTPNPNLVDWASQQSLTGTGKTAIVVGCGYGDDAEYLASFGFKVIAFDISPTAITVCQQRFPNSSVSYQVVDLFNAPQEWLRKFDLIFECYTLQALPNESRKNAIAIISQFLAPSGQLLLITRGRDESEPSTSTPPFALTQSELKQFEDVGLRLLSFEDFLDNNNPPGRKFRMVYTLNQS